MKEFYAEVPWLRPKELITVLNCVQPHMSQLSGSMLSELDVPVT
jgi:hypothetical protein